MVYGRPIICFVLSLLTVGAVAEARDGGKSSVSLTYGLEWSYSVNFASSWHRNFFVEDGYERVNDKGSSFYWHSHGEVLGHVGMDMGRKVDLSVYAGYAGIAHGVPVIPMSLRCTWFYGKAATTGSMPSGWLSYIDLGSGICPVNLGMPYCSGKAGIGYRVSLSRTAKLDFLLSYRLSYASPGIYEDGEAIHGQDIKRNDNYFSAINIGIGLTF